MRKVVTSSPQEEPRPSTPTLQPTASSTAAQLIADLPDENIYKPALEKLPQMTQSNAREEDCLLLEWNAYREKTQATLQYHEKILRYHNVVLEQLEPSSIVVVRVLVPPAHYVLPTVLDGIEPSPPIQNPH